MLLFMTWLCCINMFTSSAADDYFLLWDVVGCIRVVATPSFVSMAVAFELGSGWLFLCGFICLC